MTAFCTLYAMASPKNFEPFLCRVFFLRNGSRRAIAVALYHTSYDSSLLSSWHSQPTDTKQERFLPPSVVCAACVARVAAFRSCYVRCGGGGGHRLVSSVRQSLPPDVDKWGVSLQLLMGAVVAGGVVCAGCYRWMHENVITDPDCVDAGRCAVTWGVQGS